MRASRRALLSILLAMTVAWGAPTRGAGQQDPQRDTVEVIAQNRTAFDVRVYVLQEGHLVPLAGVVPEMGDVTLSLPPVFDESAGPIQLVADLIGSDAWHTSEPITVNGRDRIEFTIEDEVSRARVVAAP
jgi:hypothetical protein